MAMYFIYIFNECLVQDRRQKSGRNVTQRDEIKEIHREILMWPVLHFIWISLTPLSPERTTCSMPLKSGYSRLLDNKVCICWILRQIIKSLWYSMVIKSPGRSFLQVIVKGPSTLLVSPRQTSIYVMCPWDHDIWSLLFTTPSEPCQKMLM